MTQTVLVTGGAGFIGSNLVRLLRRERPDWTVVNLDKLTYAGNAESLPDVQKSPLIQNLVQQRVRLQRQLSELSATLLPAHPRMRQIRADLDGLERQIKSDHQRLKTILDDPNG